MRLLRRVESTISVNIAVRVPLGRGSAVMLLM